MFETKAWQELLQHKARLATVTIKDLFAVDPQRFKELSFTQNNFLYDISKQRLDKSVIATLLRLAEESELLDQIHSLYRGDLINKTENRPALHTNLRLPMATTEIQQVQQQMWELIDNIHSGKLRACTGKKIKHVLSLGIGGSELGPLMATTALQQFQQSDIDLQFITNTDAETVARSLARIAPDQTICIINSKTFTTPETMINAQVIKTWLQQQLGKDAVSQLFAVTANIKAAQQFEIKDTNILAFWDWVGGRYSIWSAVGFPLALKIGVQNFKEFLAGGHEMDQHFYQVKFAENLPVLMALVGIWNINIWQSHTLAIIPYLDSLVHLPAYLQQLEMESNGKTVGTAAEYIPYATAPVIWGGVGCNGQHAYMQLLHQGSHVIPVDFIAAVNSHGEFSGQQQLLLASCLSQSKALMEGRDTFTLNKTNNTELAMAKTCPGNRPSSTILFPELTPRILGNLIAWYEHKVFVQGVIWRIQSFDQWGVELGKQLAKQLLPFVYQGDLDLNSLAQNTDLESSSVGLLQYINQKRG